MRKQKKLDKALADTFPASDPVAMAEPGPSDGPPTSPAKRSMDFVDATDDQELRFWAKELDVDVERVRQAVEAVGTELDKVRRYIKDNTRPSGTPGSGRSPG